MHLSMSVAVIQATLQEREAALVEVHAEYDAVAEQLEETTSAS
jgi:hypothetical protein